MANSSFKTACADLMEMVIANAHGKTGFNMREKFWRKKIKSLGERPFIGVRAEFAGYENIEIDDYFSCGNSCYLAAAEGGTLTLGKWVALNHSAHINASLGGEISIADRVLIGPNVVLRASDHNYQNKDEYIQNQGHNSGKIYVEEDVWIGANVVVCKNVVIGKGAVIGAGSVVTKDIEPYSVVVGVPAKCIGRRE